MSTRTMPAPADLTADPTLDSAPQRGVEIDLDATTPRDPDEEAVDADLGDDGIFSESPDRLEEQADAEEAEEDGEVVALHDGDGPTTPSGRLMRPTKEEAFY